MEKSEKISISARISLASNSNSENIEIRKTKAEEKANGERANATQFFREMAASIQMQKQSNAYIIQLVYSALLLCMTVTVLLSILCTRIFCIFCIIVLFWNYAFDDSISWECCIGKFWNFQNFGLKVPMIFPSTSIHLQKIFVRRNFLSSIFLTIFCLQNLGIGIKMWEESLTFFGLYFLKLWYELILFWTDKVLRKFLSWGRGEYSWAISKRQTWFFKNNNHNVWV